MKKLLVALSLLLSVSGLNAQPWMAEFKNGPVKLQDVIDKYKHSAGYKEEEEEEAREKHEGNKVEKEGMNYLFNRWVWYQKQHLDENGYMISPVKTYTEWTKYQDKLNKNIAARTTASPANWVFQGPDSTPGGYSGLGRINAIAFHPTNPNIVLAGSSGGGTWKTDDAGHTWAPLYGNLPTLGVSDIVFNHDNPNTIYVATGDADAGDNYSMGVVKTKDGGITWNNTGLLWTPTANNNARSMVMNAHDTSMLVLATNVGIYVTRNGGTTWTNVRSGDFRQVLYHPTDTSIIYATTNNGSSCQVMRTINSGATWTTVTSLTNANRIRLAVSPGSPDLVMALASEGGGSGLLGVYGSTNKGASFTPLYEDDAACSKNILGYDLGLPTTACGGQGWYDLCIAIDPVNANKVTIGGVNNYYSSDGGLTWQLVTQWYAGVPGVQTVHADKHFLGYNPRDGILYQGCDGGIYNTLDPLTGIWTNITNGMGITQFYRGAVANGVPWGIGGAQDNGTKMVNNGISSDLTGGDGMQCRIDYESPTTTWYTASQNGSLNRTVDGGANYTNISGSIPTSGSGNWITPYIIHPLVNANLLVGIEKIFASSDQGASWVAISPQFSTSNNVNLIEMCPTDGNYIYALVDDNTIHFSPDYGVTWSNITTSLFGNTISRMAVEPKNRDILWVTLSGYGGARVASYNRATSSWTLHTGTLPNLPVNCIVIDSFSGTKYIGTDVAVYYMDNTMTDWALYNTNLPSVEVQDLAINYTSNEIWAFTYGRGMWKSAKNEHPVGISVVPYVADAITVTPNPNRGTFAVTTGKTNLFNQQVTVRLISTDGRTLYQDDTRFDNAGSLKVSTHNLIAGTYICEVRNEKNVARCRVVIY